MVRNKLLLCLLLFCVNVVWAAEATDSEKKTIPWLASYSQGIKQARSQNRPVLIKFYADWCSWCERMNVEAFAEKDVIQALAGYTCIKIDVDKHTNVALAYKIRSLPRIIVINTHQEIIGDWIGYQRSDRFLSLVRDLEPALRKKMGTTPAPNNIPETTPTPQESQIVLNLDDEPTKHLGHKDPKVRQQATEQWLKRGPSALPDLMNLLEHSYLGVRISSWQLIKQLHPTSITFDPWAPKTERTSIIEQLNKELNQ